MTMRRLSLAFILPVSLAVAPAHAGQVRIGSDLRARATLLESAPVDSVYWNTRLASAGRVTSPAGGEVSVVRLKGRIDRSKTSGARPQVVMHVQVLRPQPGGRVRAIVTSGNLKLPFGGSPDRITAYKLQRMPARICVRPGDFVALSTSGGFGTGFPGGAGFRTFAAEPGSAFAGFTAAGKDMDGDVFAGRERADRELLLRATIATGRDARPSCR